MISLVTSTIIPSAYSYFSPAERYIQTLHTLNSLAERGFEEIFVFDNSVSELEVEGLLNSGNQKVKLFQNKQYSFENKGLNEALLILNLMENLPENTPIFKISGRYYPTEKFNKIDFLERMGNKEILGICENLHQNIAYFSTRSYLIKNKQVLKEMLILSIEEMIAYGRDAHTISGLVKQIFSFFTPKIGTPFQLSLEQAFARIIKQKNNYTLVKAMNIEGYVAGAAHQDFVSE